MSLTRRCFQEQFSCWNTWERNFTKSTFPLKVQSIAMGDVLSCAKHTDATATNNVRIFILLVRPFADRSYHFVIAV